MGKVRAKFRCMEISRFWNGECTIVRFLPVMAKCDRFPHAEDVSEENARFWDATPSGEAKLTFKTLEPAEVEYELGRCYYIDMESSTAPEASSDAEGVWKLRERTQRENQLDVVLARSWSDEVKMSISNQGAWQAFGGKVGGSWSVTFAVAP